MKRQQQQQPQKADSRYYHDFMLFANDILEFNKEKSFELGEFHKDIIKTVLAHRYSAIMIPRGFLKTTLIARCYPLWRAYRENNYDLCLVSSTLDLAMDNLAYIQDTLEKVPWLQHLCPRNKSESWNRSQLNTTNGNKIYIRPYSANARGIHPNEVVYDDVQREKNISMTEIINTFKTIFFPMGQTKLCKHTIIGTPMSTDDLLFRCKDMATKSHDWGFMTLSAIVKDKDGNESSLWKERYTMQELNDIRESMGSYNFAREYMCDPTAMGSGFFPSEMVLNCTDDDMTFNYNTEGEVILGADFAMSDSPSGDYTVFTVIDSIIGKRIRKLKFGKEIVEVEIENPVIIKHIDRFKSTTGQVSRLKYLYDIYHASKVIVDASTFGQRFSQELREQNVVVSNQDFSPSSRNMLLINLRRLIETDNVREKPARLIIPTSEEDFTFDKTKILINEMSGFAEATTAAGTKTIASNCEHDDIAMSLALAVRDIAMSRQIPNQIVFTIPGF